MPNWTFYPAFVATVVSIIGLSRLAVKEHDQQSPRTLSELAAAEQRLLVHFRNILVFCGLLFAVTVFWFIAPRTANTAWVILAGSLMTVGELLASVVPARDKTRAVHTVMAQVMAVGMLGLALSFCIDLGGSYSLIELALMVAMCILGLFTWIDKKRFILYELGFIFSSHISILIAAIALQY
jgi:hypothetical protein